MTGQVYRETSIFGMPLMQFLVGVLLFAALLFTQRNLIIAAVLILGLMTLLKIWSRLSSSGVTCLSTVDKDRLFPGEKFTLRLRVENAKFLPVWLQISLFSASDLVFYPDEMPPARQGGLLGYQRALFKWQMIARKRGVYRIGPPHLRIGDFFGFFLKEKKEQHSLEIIVYPKLIPLKPLSLPRRDFFGVPVAKSPVHDPAYILGTRDYQHNQPARHIHWKASARHDRLQEKVFEPTLQAKVLLVLEVDQFVAKEAVDKFERTLEVMASLAVQLYQNGYAMGLATNGITTAGGPALVPVAGTTRQLSAILEVLARLQMKSNGTLSDVLQKGMSLTWGVSCVHFSYQQDASTLASDNYFFLRRTASLFVLCRPPSETSRDENRIQSTICLLDELPIDATEGL